MKRLAVLMMVGCLAACGGEDGTSTGSQNNANNATTNNATTNNATTNNATTNNGGNTSTGNNGDCTPSAEVCDGVDNDCDGEVDEEAVDAETFYADDDGDNFGDEATTIEACEAPEGYVATGGDCADDDADRNPQADEICDNIDNNCNGDTDESFPDLEDRCTAGLGVCEEQGEIVCTADGTGTECSAVAGTPTEMPESTCDGIDADCDGVVDNGCDDDMDGWCDENFDVTTDTALCAGGTQLGDCNDDIAEVNPGVVVGRCDGVDDDCDGDTDEIEEADRSFPSAEYEFPADFTLEFGADAAYETSYENFAGVMAAPMDDGSWCIGANDRTTRETYLVHFDPNSQGQATTSIRPPGGFHTRDVAAIGNYCAALIGNDFAKRVTIMDVTTGVVQEIVPGTGQDQAFVRRGGLSALSLNGVDTFVWTLVNSSNELVYQTIPANGVDGDQSAPAIITDSIAADRFSTSDVVGTSLWTVGPTLNQFNTVSARVYEVNLTNGNVGTRGILAGAADGWVGGFAEDGTSVASFRFQQPRTGTVGRMSIQSYVFGSWSSVFGVSYGVSISGSDHLTATTWAIEPLDPALTTRFWVLDSYRDHLRVSNGSMLGTTYAHSALDYVSNGTPTRRDLIAAQNIDGDIVQMLYLRPVPASSTMALALAEYSCF